jgi:hypothetical protein
MLVGLIRVSSSTLPDIIEGKALEGFAIAGDWDAYLRKKLRDFQFEGDLLPHMSEYADQFFESLGLER